MNMKLYEAIKLLEEGKRVRHQDWPSNSFLVLRGNILDQDGELDAIVCDSVNDLDGWELLKEDGWYKCDGKDYIKFDDWYLWCDGKWMPCNEPKHANLERAGNFEPKRYTIQTKLVDDIPF